METVSRPGDNIQLTDEKGFVNIGSHPDNDVILTGENIQPFHMMLDYTKTPYRIFPLSNDSEVWVNGNQISLREAYTLSESDTIDIASFRMKVTPKNGKPGSISISELSGFSSVTDVGYHVSDKSLSLAGETATVGLGMTGADSLGDSMRDEYIIALLDHDSAVINTEQSAYFTLTLTNGSPIVSTFHVQIVGVPVEWVAVSPANVNLNEGARAQVNISITPPRMPTSTAGLHPFRLIVTSLNHPGRQTVLSATIEINPYYDYAIDDISPRRVKIPWSRRYKEVNLDVTNKGNNSNPFLLVAQDDDNECTFHFIASTGLRQLTQVDYVIPPGETQTIPVQISPIKRSLIRLSPKQYPYRVVVTQPENQATSLFTLGTAISSPLIGIIGIILALLIIAGTTAYLFTPRINEFSVDNTVIGVGESTTLHWKAPIFTHKLSITGVETPVNSSQGSLVILPTETVNTYTFNASTWLWTLLNLEPRTKTLSVLAVPGEPDIKTFTLSDNDVLVGDRVTLRYSVDHANKVLLTINGVAETFEDAKDFNGQRDLDIESDTLVSLQATNALGSVVSSNYIFSRQPSIVIDKFELDKTSIYIGEQVTIMWKISGVGMENGGAVTISPFDSILPLEGQMTFFPSESMEFVLTATNRNETESRILPVGVLEPEAEPSPPTIDFFTAAPDTLTGAGNVELSWSVSGSVDSIVITNGSSTVASGLSAQGFKTIAVSESGTYVLTATYAGKKVGSNLKITVNPDLLDSTLKVTNVYPNSNLELGDEVLVSISLVGEDKDTPPTGKVVVSDGSASCEITLPVTSCKLTFTTPGTKYIKAVYQGDANYVQVESTAYKALTVGDNNITIVATIVPNIGTSNTSVYYDEKYTLRVRIEGTNDTRVPDAELRVKRLCDDTAVYDEECFDKYIGYHKLEDADSGFYEFSGLTVDQFNGTYTLLVTFINDSFYSDTTEEFPTPVSAKPIPLTITATPSVDPALVNTAMTYLITVAEITPGSIKHVPIGTVELTATNSGTEVTCEEGKLVLDTTGSATCTITPIITGLWGIVVKYKVDGNDPWHEDTTSNPSTLGVNANTTLALRGTDLDFTYGVGNTVGINITRDDDSSMVTSGILSCSTDIGTCGSCAYQSASGYWTCSVKPTLTEVLPVSNRTVTYSYTPSAYLNGDSESFLYSVSKADTVVAIKTQPSGPYSVGGSYTLELTLTHADGGDAPTSGSYKVQLGSGDCTASGMSSSSTYFEEATIAVGSTYPVTFTQSYAIGSDLRFCVQYLGGDSYNASPWKDSTAFRVKGTSTWTIPDAMTIIASDTSNSSLVSYTNFTVTMNDAVSFNIDQAYIVLDSDETKIVCAKNASEINAGSTLKCKYVSHTGSTITWQVATSVSNFWLLKPLYKADANNDKSVGNSFKITSMFKILGLDTPTYDTNASKTILTYYAGETSLGADDDDGEIMTTTVKDTITFANFPDNYDYASHFTLELDTVDPNSNYINVTSDSNCSLTNTSTGGYLYCSGIKSHNSTHNGFIFKLNPTDTTKKYCIGDSPCTETSIPQSSSAQSVNILENILESLIIPNSADQTLTKAVSPKTVQYRCAYDTGLAHNYIVIKLRLPVDPADNVLNGITVDDLRYLYVNLSCNYNSDGVDYVQTYSYRNQAVVVRNTNGDVIATFPKTADFTVSYNSSTKTIDVVITPLISSEITADEGDQGCHGNGDHNDLDKVKLVISFATGSDGTLAGVVEDFYTVFEWNYDKESHRTYYTDNHKFFNCDDSQSSSSTFTPE